MRKLFALLALAFSITIPSWASCNTSTLVTTPDYASVNACVSAAPRNGVVSVSAGSATWSSTLNITTGLTLTGAGAGNTIITSNTIMIAADPDATAIANGEHIKITGFTFDGNNTASIFLDLAGASGISGTKAYCCYVIGDNTFRNAVAGTSNGVITATDPNGNGQLRGVIYGNTFDRTDITMRVFSNNDTREWANTAFNNLAFGTSDNLFFENNTIQYSSTYSGGNCGWIETGQGGRLVARYNTYNGTNCTTTAEFNDIHGFQNWNGTVNSGQTGSMISERYGNTYTNVTQFRAENMRGGIDLTFNNILTGSGSAGISIYGQTGGASCPSDINPAPSNYNPLMQLAYFWNNTVNGTNKLASFDYVGTLGCTVTENNGAALGTLGSGSQGGWWNQNTSACTSSSCTAGVGQGTTAPTGTCTTGTAYWVASTPGATTNPNVIQNAALYQCTSTNTWTKYYTPYTYPNPLISGNTWFIRADGGTRYSTNVTTGQCDGLADVAYPGSGVNQHCAFNDIRYLWVDNSGAPMSWVISGGDLMVVRGCTALPSQANPSNPNCRLGYDSETNGNPPNSWCGFGVPNTNCFPAGIPNGVVLGSITAISVSGGVATVTANNTLSAGNVVMFNGLSGGPSVGPAWLAGQDMNGRSYIVTGTGLSSTQFEVLATEPNGSWSDTGQFARPTIIEGGCAYDSTPGPCFTGNSTNTANLVTIYSGMGLSAAINLQVSQFFAINGINLTTHNKVDSGTPFTPSGTYTAGQIIFDGTNTQAVTIGGAAGSTPSWNPVVGGTTTTGAVTFKNEGPNCTRLGNPAYPVRCATGTPYDDWGDDGFLTFSNTGPGSFTDVWAHGFSASGFHGPIGGAITMTRVNSSFNTMAGYNFDLGPLGPNSTGFPNNPAASIAMSYVTMDWNGCNAEYPVIDAIPCLIAYSITNNGFGDALSGQDSNLASATCDHCEFAFNVKDPWLGPHTATGNVKITNSYAASSGGQTWKGNLGVNGKFLMQNNVTNANCRRLFDPITGAPSTFNAGIASGDMCRADGTAISILWPVNGSFELDNNTFVSASINVGFDFGCYSLATGISSIPNAGTGYAVNDVIYLGGGGTVVTVTGVGAGGAITSVSLTTAGQIVNPFETYNFTTGGGSGATFNVSTVPANCGGGPRVMRNNNFIGYTNTNNPTWNGSTINFICYSGCQGNPGNSNDTQWTTRSNNNMYGFQNGNDGACTYPGETCTSPLMTIQPVQVWTNETQLDPYNPKLTPSANSFYPGPTSPLIHAGITIAGITADYFGVARPSPPTIGAVEPFGGVAPPSGLIILGGKSVLTGKYKLVP